jgi:CRISPR-associated endonuclease/helicase Cas3
MAYAHSKNDQGQRHDLVAHLRRVADLSATFASDFQAREPAYYLGLWHDLGKFHPTWQRYLLESEAKSARRGHSPDHKLAGTILAQQHLGLAALLVHGHHGGLKTPNELKGFLADPKLEAAARQALELARGVITDLNPDVKVVLPDYIQRNPLAAELFLRLIFSALVDADSLDTEEHFSRARADQRRSSVTLDQLWERLARAQEQFSNVPGNPVQEARRTIYQACLAAAEGPPGLYRLTVPTGGGKTRSGMAFALRHALRHGQRRVIVAVPFISITEQTAEVYRSVFRNDGDDGPVVLEHHSGHANRSSDEEDFHPNQVWERLSAENWDAPVIVTTTVQLFESLFANGRGQTRKLHRLARSVIILDEAQALPPHLLDPILDALQQLCNHFGTTVVLSTATQPAFESIPKFASLQATEIVPEPGRFFDTLRRVTYEWRCERAMPWTEVTELLQRERQALVVVNTKRDAMACLHALDDGEALHLSTLLCGAHRRTVLKLVKEKLASNQVCRLVSTQVVEAGVDLDFPLVLRALGPLDSIIQAAGRCNREGQLARGRIIVFQSEGGSMPPGPYRMGADVTRALLTQSQDPDDPDMTRAYFRQFLETLNTGTDRERIQELRRCFNYPEVARKFRMIDDLTESVVITVYGSAQEKALVKHFLAQLRDGSPDARVLLRELQPYLVSLRTRQAERYRQQGLIAPVFGTLGEWRGAYDQVRGLVADPSDLDLDALVV